MIMIVVINKTLLYHDRHVYIFLVIVMNDKYDNNNNNNDNNNINDNDSYKQNSSLSWQACVHLPGDHWSGDFLRHRGGARGLHVLQEAIIKIENKKRLKKN